MVQEPNQTEPYLWFGSQNHLPKKPVFLSIFQCGSKLVHIQFFQYEPVLKRIMTLIGMQQMEWA